MSMNSNYYLPCPRAGMFLEQWAITWNSDGRINFSENCKILSWNHEWHLFFNEFLYVPVTDVITYYTKKNLLPPVHHIIAIKPSLAPRPTKNVELAFRKTTRVLGPHWRHWRHRSSAVDTVEAISILWSQIRQKGAKFWIETLIASKERLK